MSIQANLTFVGTMHRGDYNLILGTNSERVEADSGLKLEESLLALRNG